MTPEIRRLILDDIEEQAGIIGELTAYARDDDSTTFDERVLELLHQVRGRNDERFEDDETFKAAIRVTGVLRGLCYTLVSALDEEEIGKRLAAVRVDIQRRRDELERGTDEQL